MPRQVCEVSKYSTYSVLPTRPDITSRREKLSSTRPTYSMSSPGLARSLDHVGADAAQASTVMSRKSRSKILNWAMAASSVAQLCELDRIAGQGGRPARHGA